MDSTTVAIHAEEIYYKPCYGKKNGSKGYGYGQGAMWMLNEGLVGVDHRKRLGMKPESAQPHRPTTDPNASKFAQIYGGNEEDSQGGNYVRATEKITGPGNSWHKNCFFCGNCGRSLESTSLTEKESEIYCKEL
nr:cysteine and glycine-rich protein 2-like [Dasypus novemcinctus]